MQCKVPKFTPKLLGESSMQIVMNILQTFAALLLFIPISKLSEWAQLFKVINLVS